jgi:hypothetical protein
LLFLNLVNFIFLYLFFPLDIGGNFIIIRPQSRRFDYLLDATAWRHRKLDWLSRRRLRSRCLVSHVSRGGLGAKTYYPLLISRKIRPLQPEHQLIPVAESTTLSTDKNPSFFSLCALSFWFAMHIVSSLLRLGLSPVP